MLDYETYSKFDQRNNKILLACFYVCLKGKVFLYLETGLYQLIINERKSNSVPVDNNSFCVL